MKFTLIKVNMKKIRQVVSRKNLGRVAPANTTLFIVILIEIFDLFDSIIGAIIIGAVSVPVIFLWVMYFIDLINYDEQSTDIFNKPDKPSK
jgi:hypothetical protein